MSSNYPPGVTESMIPGFRPQDEEAERYVDGLSWDEELEWVEEQHLDCAGGVVYELEDEGEWAFEPPDQDVLMPTVAWETFEAYRSRPKWAKRWPLRSRRLRRFWPPTIAIRLRFATKWDALAYMLAFYEEEIIEAMVTEHLEEGDPYGY